MFLLSLGITLLLFWCLSRPWGTIPPPGPFLNPFSGFWANAVTHNPENKHLSLDNPALKNRVDIIFDDHNIPHIFAQSDSDLYFAQGYITARQRLWQMEFQTHAAAGRLSEIIGERALEYDRYQRRIGMVYAAEQAMKSIREDPQTLKALEAYTAGVNTWIEQLQPHNVPLEYKLLNYTPEPWKPVKSALLFKYMTHMLARDDQDLAMSNTRAYFGSSFIKKVLDLKTPWIDPTIPARITWDFEPLDIPKPDSPFTPTIVDTLLPFKPDPANGSNNWAVSGDKTASGYPILANDPHLNMSLPSIWYAVQLHSPHQNVMGVSLPGSPAVIIGFNENIAWGTTNVGADVLDWYEITFRDSSLSAYKYENEWRKTKKRIEEIRIKDSKTVHDTVIYTHHGPVVHTATGQPTRSNIPKHHAMRWIAYEKSNEVKFFLQMNRATNYDDYRKALPHFDSPAQNWVFADSQDIALTVSGKFPLKWDQQGRYISDGSSKDYEWQGWIPFDQVPFVKNPARGFVSSANQDPVDENYHYYLDDNFAPFERGRRINDRLHSMDSITVDDMRNLQLDNYSYHAEKVLPLMLEKLNTDTLSGSRGEAADLLNTWNYENTGRQIAPSLFKYWWDELYYAIWRDEFQSTDLPLRWPARDQTAWLLVSQPELTWYDNITTSHTETRREIINTAFRTALEELNKAFGPYGEAWQWGYVNETTLEHVARIPGLSKQMFTDGGAESVNAIRGGHGPSWRMVVQLGPDLQAYGVYPGGQSGNPGSPHYTDWTRVWNSGKLFKLKFFRRQPTSADSIKYSITLE